MKKEEKVFDASESQVEDNQKVLFILNFGRKLPDPVIKEIETKTKAIVTEEQIKVNINLSKVIYIQIVDIIDSIPKELLKGNKKILVNLPGLPIAAAYIIVELHARMGFFPLVLELYRDHAADNIWNDWNLKRIVDLEYERSISRSKMFGGELP